MSQPTPPTMRVAVELGFVIGCVDCLAILESTAAAAFRDKQVTRFVASPGKKHAHIDGDAQSALTEVVEPTDSLFPISDTNGSHPDDVSGINGLDPEGRQ